MQILTSFLQPKICFVVAVKDLFCYLSDLFFVVLFTMSQRLCLLVVVALICNLQMVAAGTSISETIQGFLVPQNEARKQVGVAPLKWDVKLTTYVRTYARERRGVIGR